MKPLLILLARLNLLPAASCLAADALPPAGGWASEDRGGGLALRLDGQTWPDSDLIDHLFTLGHREIRFTGGDPNHRNTTLRNEAFGAFLRRSTAPACPPFARSPLTGPVAPAPTP